MIGMTNAGSGGGLSINAAVIHVKAPLGSTVTFSKGGVIVKTIDPTKAHTNNDGKNADYYFSVLSSNYGNWVITATFETKTSSKTITVNAIKWYDVELSYELVLINNGIIQTEFIVVEGGDPGSAIIANEKITFGNLAGVGAVRTTNKVDVTDYNTLIVEIDAKEIAHTYWWNLVVTDGTTIAHYIQNSTDPELSKPIEYLAYTQIQNAADTILTATLNISSITGMHYIGIGEGANNGAQINELTLK